MQSVLEAKFLHGQEVYRFEVEHEPGMADTHTFLLNLARSSMQDMAGQEWRLRRRPLLVTEHDIADRKM